MEKPSDVNLSSSDASVSNIPTATPIASEIISDFEPDPKFEITPLEKATFDCNELLLHDSNLSTLVQHSENGDMQEENGADKSDKDQVSQDSGVHNDDKGAKTLSQIVANVEHKPKEDSQTPSTHTRVDDELLSASSNDIPKINDCPSSFDKNENDADHLTATISLDESIAATALVEVAERADALTSHNMKESDHNRQQYSAITTSQQTAPVHTSEGNDAANYLFSNSQTSVDALRDKVIESALELGEAHDFSHAPIQVEDRDKLFESIHREVTGIQSSIDLIADVASQQQSIQINPIEPQKKEEQQGNAEPSPDRPTPRLEIELTSDAQLSSPSKHDAQTPEPEASNNSGKQEVSEVTLIPDEPEKASAEKAKEEEIAKPSEEIVCETIDASEVGEEIPPETPQADVEPIVEEPPTTSEVPEIYEKNETEPEDTKKVLADIIVEPLESADETVEQLNLQPVVEEASSADEQEQSDNLTEAKTSEEVAAEVIAESDQPTEPKCISETGPTEVEEIQKEPQDDSPKVSAATVEATSNKEETGRRKSARKVRPTMLLDEQPKVEEPRRGSRRISSRRRQDEGENQMELVESAQKNHEMPVPESADQSEEKGAIEFEQQKEPAQTKKQEPKKKEKQVVKDDEQIEQMEIDQTKEESGADLNSAQQTESESVEEPTGRSSRSLRVRAPKRKFEEVIPEPEPPKKQAKRSRQSSDQLNKSTAAPRATSIKLPALKSRMTISTSDPSSRPGAHRERAAVASPASNKKYVCNECGFGTDRLDNIVYHNTKSFCQGKSARAEMMKNDIIKQQQSKGRRKQPR